MSKPADSRSRNLLEGLAWVVGSTLLLYVQAILPYWIFADRPELITPVQAVFLGFLLLSALHVWACVAWLTPFLRRRYPDALAPRMVFGQLAIVCGVVLLTILVYLQIFPWLMGRPVNPGGQFSVAYRVLMVAGFVYGWLLIRDFSREDAARALRLRLDTESMATDVDRSELALLEAQIEPHFLFNTLAHVKRLYRHDAAAADALTAALIDYLERALPALRRDDWRLDDELGLIDVYLSLIARRFGDRLRYTISADPGARACGLPALVVATLVENAVRHGLSPAPAGGSILVHASRDEHALTIDVSDTGVGLRAGSGGGLGLATVRARLRGRFGPGAALTVTPGAQTGVLATIRIPLGGGDA